MTCTEELPWPRLAQPLLEELRRAPAGLSEFELIRRLQDREDTPEFRPGALTEPLPLYRTHFILFHCLYRLAGQLRDRGEDLSINCLDIRIVKRRAGETSLSEPDPLRAFYLDADNLANVDAEHVEKLLGDFWIRLTRHDRRAQALSTLGLADPVSDADIKARYRRLVMRHHPDRGGDNETLQTLNEAVGALLG